MAERAHRPRLARLVRRTSSRVPCKEDEERCGLLSGLSGRVIEVGAGNGLNFGLYPEAVDEVLAVESEPLLRELAITAAAEAPTRIEVLDGAADELPAARESFDAGVASLLLCSVPDPEPALAELRQVIRVGGELRFYGDAPASKPLRRFADVAFRPRIGGGVLHRDAGDAIERAGFQIESLRLFTFTPDPPMPALPHIMGVARRL